MFFIRRAQVVNVSPLEERLLPVCYDEFRGTKIFNIIEHPKPEGDRVFLRVPYAGSAAVKARGARWDPDARRWWYCSGGTAQLAHDNNPAMWLETLAAGHARSVFSEYPMDEEYMRRIKFETWPEIFFDYVNPEPSKSIAHEK